MSPPPPTAERPTKDQAEIILQPAGKACRVSHGHCGDRRGDLVLSATKVPPRVVLQRFAASKNIRGTKERIWRLRVEFRQKLRFLILHEKAALKGVVGLVIEDW